MIPDTVVGVLVLVVVVLPGLSYTLAFERQAGDYGATLADRTLRFIAVSAIFHILAAWPEYWLYRTVLADGRRILAGQFALLWLAVIVALALPVAAGTYLGTLYGTRTGRTGWQQTLLRATLGPTVAPRAWDDLFSAGLSMYLRVRTTDGTWLAGLFASRSYAAGFPQEPDLLLEDAYQVDPATGELGESLGYPLYIAAEQIAWMEVVRPEGR